MGIISQAELLEIWQGNRNLTRRVIEAFSEKDLFEFSIGGMRPFGEMCKEFLAIGVPGLKEILAGEKGNYAENSSLDTKEKVLAQWDKDTQEINELWSQFTPEKFQEVHNLFGEYSFPVIHNIMYFIENEIHHRGQGYVYLRALGIQPPFFWER